MALRTHRLAFADSDHDSLLRHPELIGQAKRVLMRRYQLSDSESLVRLQRLARDQRVRLVDVARSVLREEVQLDTYA